MALHSEIHRTLFTAHFCGVQCPAMFLDVAVVQSAGPRRPERGGGGHETLTVPGNRKGANNQADGTGLWSESSEREPERRRVRVSERRG